MELAKFFHRNTPANYNPIKQLCKEIHPDLPLVKHLSGEEKNQYSNDKNQEVVEINKQIVIVGEQIGRGANKIVKKGTLITKDGTKDVAIQINKIEPGFIDKLIPKKLMSKVNSVSNKILSEVDQLNKYKDHPNIEDPPYEKGILASSESSSEIHFIRVVPLAIGSIEKHLKEDMTLPKVLNILANAATGLGEMHEKEEAHSDIKPQNILVTKDNIGQISDLEMGGKIGENAKGATDGYLDKEAPKNGNGRILDKESDIYAFGYTLQDITKHSEWYDLSDPKQQEIRHEIDELVKLATHSKRANRPTAGQFAARLAEIAKKAESIEFKPLGEKNLTSKVFASQEARVFHEKVINSINH